ncbi:MAG: hypothetical protein IJU94_01365 [Clostridia bacterium]|nr:hypothetical protein [Clostridia bacterium]
MRKAVSFILLAALLVTLPAALFGCGASAADSIKGIYMTSAGVLLISDETLAVRVYDRHGEQIYNKLTKLKKEDYPELEPYMTAKKAFLLDFTALAEINGEGSYKCRYSVNGENSYIEHTYVVSASPAETPEVFSAEATADDGVARLTVTVDPKRARLFKVWTDGVSEDSRFPDSALECVSGYDQIARGEMVYELPVAGGRETVFYTRGLYNFYGYEDEDIIKVNNPEYPDFVTPCVCLELLNPADGRVYNLGSDTHMQKFTVYSPSESVKLASVYSAPPLPEPEKTVFSAELVAEGGKAKLKVNPFPNAVYYRAVITEHYNGKTRVVCNATLTTKLVAQADIRKDGEAVYTGNVYAMLSDGTMTEKLELEGFATSFVETPTPTVTYENGEVKAVFPRKAKVSVWRSGSEISTDTMVIGSDNVYTYTPEGPGEYGFIFKVFGNGAQILDSGLIDSPKVKVD